MDNPDRKALNVMWYSVKDFEGDGEIAVLTLKVLTDVKGAYPFSVKFNQGDILNSKIEVVPATAEDGKIVLSDSATVSGKCTSFVDDDESVTIRLFRKGESEPCSETTVTGDSGKYSFEGVTAGAYIIEASAESHNTFSKEINVSRPVTVDITLYISCDADGDGEVTMKDVLLMRKFIAGIISEDGIVMGGADYNGDGDVTMADVLVIRKIIAGII